MIRDTNGEVHFTYDNRALYAVAVEGRNILRMGGIIGSCTGADEPGNNVRSWDSDGRTLYAPGNCRGAPFSWSCSRRDGRTLEVSLTIGPLPVPYRTLSVPFDFDPSQIETYLFPAAHEVGCATRWERRAGTGGRFDQIPRWCVIEGHGTVGAAKVRGPVAWLEIQGPRVHVRRIIQTRAHAEGLVYEHPDTRNIEVGLSPANGLPAGWSVTHREWLVVTPLHAVVVPAPSPATRAQIEGLYRELLNRAPDPGGMAHYLASGLTEIGVREDIMRGEEYAKLHPVPGTPTPPPVAAMPPTIQAPPPTDPRWPVPAPGAATVAQILDLYATLLRRTPDRIMAGEVLHHLGEGRSLEDLRRVFLGSEEYRRLPPLPPSGQATEAEITALYRELLNREPDPGGLQHYLTSGLSAAGVRADIMAGPEYANLHPPDAPPGPSPSPVGTPPVFRANAFVGYWPVNTYVTLGPAELERGVKAIYSAGLTLVEIEGVAWFDESGPKGQSDRYDIGIITALHELTMAHDITLQVTAVNANGAKQISRDDAWYRDYITKLQAAIPSRPLPSGRPSSILCPVSEPGGRGSDVEKCNRWTRMAQGIWSGPIVGNGPGGSGRPAVGGYSWTSWHFCSDPTVTSIRNTLRSLNAVPGHLLVSTDCTPVLNPGPARAAAITRACLEVGTGLIIYAFDKQIDYATIISMGAVIQDGGIGTHRYEPGPPSASPSDDAIDLSTVVWLHQDVSGWRRTSTVTRTTITDTEICIYHTKSGQWPTAEDGIEGNPWIFARFNGRWHAATYEWLRSGQQCKGVTRGGTTSVGNHTKRPPFPGWVPARGEEIGLMVSTLARDARRTSNERSNVVVVRWP